MDKESLYSLLVQNADNGTVEFRFSSDMATKEEELAILGELESEHRIQEMTAALGYSVYRLL